MTNQTQCISIFVKKKNIIDRCDVETLLYVRETNSDQCIYSSKLCSYIVQLIFVLVLFYLFYIRFFYLVFVVTNYYFRWFAHIFLIFSFLLISCEQGPARSLRKPFKKFHYKAKIETKEEQIISLLFFFFI